MTEQGTRYSQEHAGHHHQGTPPGCPACRTQEQLDAIRMQARRYLEATYGEDVWYQSPETLTNVLEQWIWTVAQGAPSLGDRYMSEIEQHWRDRRQQR